MQLLASVPGLLLYVITGVLGIAALVYWFMAAGAIVRGANALERIARDLERLANEPSPRV